MWPLPMMHWISLFRALSVLAPPLDMGPPWPWPTCWWHLVSSLETSWTSMYKALPPMVLISGGHKSTYGWLLLFCVCNTLADPRGGGATVTSPRPFFPFPCSFRGKVSKIIGWCCHLWGCTPHPRNPGSVTVKVGISCEEWPPINHMMSRPCNLPFLLREWNSPSCTTLKVTLCCLCEPTPMHLIQLCAGSPWRLLPKDNGSCQVRTVLCRS